MAGFPCIPYSLQYSCEIYTVRVYEACLLIVLRACGDISQPRPHQRFYESLFYFLSDRAHLAASVLHQVLTRLRCVRDVLTPCAARMTLLTSSSIPSFALSNAGGREWARMGGILHGVVHGVWQIFRFQSLSGTKLIKNCRLPS